MDWRLSLSVESSRWILLHSCRLRLDIEPILTSVWAETEFRLSTWRRVSLHCLACCCCCWNWACCCSCCCNCCCMGCCMTWCDLVVWYGCCCCCCDCCCWLSWRFTFFFLSRKCLKCLFECIPDWSYNKLLTVVMMVLLSSIVPTLENYPFPRVLKLHCPQKLIRWFLKGKKISKHTCWNKGPFYRMVSQFSITFIHSDPKFIPGLFFKNLGLMFILMES